MDHVQWTMRIKTDTRIFYSMKMKITTQVEDGSTVPQILTLVTAKTKS